jgi:hypothetical protein
MPSLATTLAAGSTGQNMGTVGLSIMSVAIMVCLGAMLIPIFVANRRPGSPRHADRQAAGRPVLGGMHRGAGRSVAPHRDAAASADHEPAGQRSPTPPRRTARR